MAKVVCMGEVVVDMFSTQVEVPLEKVNSYIAVPGGGCANVAVGLSRLEIKSGFIGMVGRDHFGKFLANALAENGVDVRGLKFTEKARTTLVFVSNTKTGEREFEFFRHPGADMMLSPEDIEEHLIAEAEIFHFGSISMSGEPSFYATLKCLEYSRRHNLVISFDPNLRPHVWKDLRQAKERIKEGLKKSQLVRMNISELEFLTGENDVEKGSNKILKLGPKTVIVTDGERGSYLSTGKLFRFVKAPEVQAVDTTGCGDGFTAAILSRMLYWKEKGRFIWELNADEIDEILMFANTAGALTATKKGVFPALPTYNQIQQLLRNTFL
ncbi:MAG TPA: carbohydrate kinase [Candidatus Aerophobetes bacterium]|uniref:Carbohydrate kinase n=1 Tax=Aerophobetes bacterium TaxID=2030807 RepID=A0A7V5LZR7_UNCAE|nr:carbohydrate kinase [Candidatus Aerophobetes bacterium]